MLFNRDKWVPLGDLQHASGLSIGTLARYLDKRETFYLGDGLRLKGDVSRYWSQQLHADDVCRFMERLRHRRQRLLGRHACEKCERMHRRIAAEWPLT